MEMGVRFANHATLLVNGKQCVKKARKPCFSSGSFNVTPVFAGHGLAVGTVWLSAITVFSSHLITRIPQGGSA